ncbi:MAG: tetratricopeptide repeat protein [Polyangiaceae bacterium]
MRDCRRSLVVFLALSSAGFVACGWNPERPFERESPEVRAAIRGLDAGEAGAAASVLTDYLSTGPCAEGNIGTPERLKNLPNGAFDLGLALFSIGESFGRRFGDEEGDAGADETTRAERGARILCALRVVRVVADDPKGEIAVRARARYLEGNLNFLDGKYEEAVKAYDQALVLAPGFPDGGDAVGRDAAWNRAIALRRIEDKKDAGNDASPDGASDASSDAKNDAPSDGSSSPDSGKNDPPDGGGGSGDDAGPDANDGGGNGNDGGRDAEPPPPEDAGPPPPSRANQDDRMLDQLERAPTVQQEAAKKAAQRRRIRAAEDK